MLTQLTWTVCAGGVPIMRWRPNIAVNGNHFLLTGSSAFCAAPWGTTLDVFAQYPMLNEYWEPRMGGCPLEWPYSSPWPTEPAHATHAHTQVFTHCCGVGHAFRERRTVHTLFFAMSQCLLSGRVGFLCNSVFLSALFVFSCRRHSSFGHRTPLLHPTPHSSRLHLGWAM